MKTATNAVGRPKLDNRREEILDAVARIFASHGFEGASMRELAHAARTQPSGLYHFFGSKEHLYESVYVVGVHRTSRAMAHYSRDKVDPWDRLEGAAIGHLTSLLTEDSFAAVVTQKMPMHYVEFANKLIVHRDAYEKTFKGYIDALALPPTDTKYLLFALLGALNSTVDWYRPGGDSPQIIAHNIVGLFKKQLQ